MGKEHKPDEPKVIIQQPKPEPDLEATHEIGTQDAGERPTPLITPVGEIATEVLESTQKMADPESPSGQSSSVLFIQTGPEGEELLRRKFKGGAPKVTIKLPSPEAKEPEVLDFRQLRERAIFIKNFISSPQKARTDAERLIVQLEYGLIELGIPLPEKIVKNIKKFEKLLVGFNAAYTEAMHKCDAAGMEAVIKEFFELPPVIDVTTQIIEDLKAFGENVYTEIADRREQEERLTFLFNEGQDILEQYPELTGLLQAVSKQLPPLEDEPIPANPADKMTVKMPTHKGVSNFDHLCAYIVSLIANKDAALNQREQELAQKDQQINTLRAEKYKSPREGEAIATAEEKTRKAKARLEAERNQMIEWLQGLLKSFFSLGIRTEIRDLIKRIGDLE